MSNPSVFPKLQERCVDPFEWAERAPADDSWAKGGAADATPIYEQVMGDPAKMISAARQSISDGGLSATLIPQPATIDPRSVAAAASSAARARDGLFDRIAERVATELRSQGWTVETGGTSETAADMSAGVLPEAHDNNDSRVEIGEAYATLRLTGEGLKDNEITLIYSATASRFLGFMSSNCGGVMGVEHSGFLAQAEHPSIKLNYTGGSGLLQGSHTLLWDQATRGGIPADELATREDEIVRALVSRLLEYDAQNAEYQARQRELGR